MGRINPKPGEVWLADLGIAGKMRPVLVISMPSAALDKAGGFASNPSPPRASSPSQSGRGLPHSIQEIESAIRELPWSEVSELRQWFDCFFEDQWDQKMRADAERGAFDSIVAEIKVEKAEGSLRNFP